MSSEANKFLPIRVSTLRGDVPIPFNAYVYVNQKYILYLRQGDTFEGERLKKLKSKKLKKMHIVRDHEKHYLTYVTESLDNAYDPNSKKPIAVRAEVIQGATQANVEEVIENVESADAYNQAKVGADRFTEFLLRENQALHALLNIDNEDNSLIHHGVNVGSLSVLVGQKLGMTNTKQLQTITLGALLHDFGHSLFDKEAQTTLVQDSNPRFKEHPKLGADRVKNLKHFDPLVIRIILEHEERSDGLGFPSGLKENQIDKLALVVGVSNHYDRWADREKAKFKDFAELIKTYYSKTIGLYPLTHLNALKGVLTTR